MALTHKAKKRWSLVILLVGMPVFVILAVSIINWLYPDPLDRPSVWVELAIYVGLGIVWAIPFKFVFKGVGQPDPDA